MAPKVVGSCENASPIDTELDMEVRPIGTPMIAVMTMVSSSPAFTFVTVNTMARTKPMRNSHSVGVFRVARPGVALMAPPLAASLGSLGVNLMNPTLSMPT